MWLTATQLGCCEGLGKCGRISQCLKSSHPVIIVTDYMNVYEIKNTVSVCVTMQYFRELQSLLQQFIIVEHAVDPAVDPSAADQQQTMDQAALESVKHESQALAADELAAQTDADAAAADMAPAEAADMAMMETSAEPSASSADDQMAFEPDQQLSTEAFVAEETGPSDIA